MKKERVKKESTVAKNTLLSALKFYQRKLAALDEELEASISSQDTMEDDASEEDRMILAKLRQNVYMIINQLERAGSNSTTLARLNNDYARNRF